MVFRDMKNKIKNKIISLSKKDFFKKNPYFYLYDLKELNKKISHLKKYLSKNFEIYYAMKANPHNKILSEISKNKCFGIEIASEGEMKKALKYFKPNRIIYTGPGKTPYELELAIQKGLKLINIESMVEAKRINEIAEKYNKKINILIRINLNKSIKSASSLMGGIPSKLGIDEDTLLSFIRECKKLKNLNILGIHAYLGTGILNYRDSINHAKYVFSLVKKIERDTFLSIKVINLGGGFGVDYTGKNNKFDIIKYSQKINKLIKDFKYTKKKIILEIGRYLVADSGYYCAKIIDIKKSKGKNFIVVSGGINHLNRPCVTGENQPVEIIHSNENNHDPFIENMSVDIVGPLCLNEDILGRNMRVKSAYIGDLLIITKAGAYSISGSPINLLSHKIPVEIFNS